MPAAVAAGPIIVENFFPRNDVAEITAAVIAPIVAALIRTAVGIGQVRRITGEPIPTGRQLAIATGIVFLMLLEGYVTMLTFADDEPWSAWLAPTLIYACYLFSIALALRPVHGSSS